MQDESIFALEPSERSRQRGLVEFAAGVHSDTGLKSVASAFPLVTEFAIGCIPQGSTGVHKADGHRMFDLIKVGIWLAWKARR